MDQFTFAMFATVCNNWKQELKVDVTQKFVIETEWLLYHKKRRFFYSNDVNFIKNEEVYERKIDKNDL